MPRRNIQIVNGEFYHLVKRGIEEREIFLDEEDRLRFVNSLLVFNDKSPTLWNIRSFWYKRIPENLTSNFSPKLPLLEIHAFALMPNHFHLLVRQLIDEGIQTFMQKLGGYSQYFNRKYKREGALFPGRYKIIHIKGENQLRNTFVYIHTNPVALIEPEWKEWKVKNCLKAIEFLENEYRWSSYRDYLGKENFPNLIKKEFFIKLFGGEREIKNEINSWIKFKSENLTNKQEFLEIILE
jgi:putative transposase